VLLPSRVPTAWVLRSASGAAPGHAGASGGETLGEGAPAVQPPASEPAQCHPPPAAAAAAAAAASAGSRLKRRASASADGSPARGGTSPAGGSTPRGVPEEVRACHSRKVWNGSSSAPPPLPLPARDSASPSSSALCCCGAEAPEASGASPARG
jgi:hypothetical protein